MKFVSYGTFQVIKNWLTTLSLIWFMTPLLVSRYPSIPICPIPLCMSMFAVTIFCQYRKTALCKFRDLQLLFSVITLLFYYYLIIFFYSMPPVCSLLSSVLSPSLCSGTEYPCWDRSDMFVFFVSLRVLWPGPDDAWAQSAYSPNPERSWKHTGS